MAVYLKTGKVEELVVQYGGNAKNTGATDAQVAIFTYRINQLSEHLKKNKKDHSCRRSLLMMVGKRRNLLKYLAKKDILLYRSLIERLGLRK